MLRLLGTIYYALAGLAVFLALVQIDRSNGGLIVMLGLSAGLSFAFFGAMCLVADDMRTLLTRIAGGPAPAAPTEPALTRRCAFCNREVPKGTPCSAMADDRLRERAPAIVNKTCRAELEARGYLPVIGG